VKKETGKTVTPIFTERLYIRLLRMRVEGCASIKLIFFYLTSSVDPFKLFKQLLKLFILF